MALHQAQDLAAAKYKLVSTLPLSQRAYIVDMTYGGNGDVGISVNGTPAHKSLSEDHSSKHFSYKTNSEVRTQILSTNGCFLGFQSNYNPEELYGVVHVTKTSVFISKDYGSPFQVWPKPHMKSDSKHEYRPQGLVVCRSGIILICLWNNEVGERSFGKVISQYGDFEIFTDKNKPLFVCPTYIAENGNGDICVSDVGAVVVTDAGGMLRFRYQATSSNFEPYGLCCDSVCNIIIADMKNDRIHVIDKDGGFLYYVMYEGIKMPQALCIDENDNVYVGEWNTDSVKVLSCKK